MTLGPALRRLSPARLRECLQEVVSPGYNSPGGWVEHALAPCSGPLELVTAQAVDCPDDIARALVRIGAVHTCPTPPHPPRHPPRASSPHRNRGIPPSACPPSAGGDSRLRTPRRGDPGQEVTAGAYLRVHVHPKRFPLCAPLWACASPDPVLARARAWHARVRAQRGALVVVDKPSGVPVVATVDNREECVASLAGRALGLAAALHPLHRLDQCTQGLVMLSSNAEHARVWHEAVAGDRGGLGQREGRLSIPPPSSSAPLVQRKEYRALTRRPPPLGSLVHWLRVGCRVAGLPSHTLVLEADAPGAKRSECVVLGVRPLAVPRARLQAALGRAWEGREEEGATEAAVLYESRILLLTGRTHQIRAQLSAEGAPCVGDALYEPLADPGLRARLRAVGARERRNDGCGEDGAFLGEGHGDGRGAESSPSLSLASLSSTDRATPLQTPRCLDGPERAIGLQAWRLELRVPSDADSQASEALVVQAGPAWWEVDDIWEAASPESFE